MVFPMNLYPNEETVFQTIDSINPKRIYILDLRPWTGSSENIWQSFMQVMNDSYSEYTEPLLFEEIKNNNLTKLSSFNLSGDNQFSYKIQENKETDSIIKYLAWRYGKYLSEKISQQCPFIIYALRVLQEPDRVLVLITDMPHILAKGLIKASRDNNCPVVVISFPQRPVKYILDEWIAKRSNWFWGTALFVNNFNDIPDTLNTTHPGYTRTYLVNPDNENFCDFKRTQDSNAFLVVSNKNGTRYFLCLDGKVYLEVSEKNAIYYEK